MYHLINGLLINVFMKKNDRSDWNNPDFVYYLLDTNAYHDILSGGDRVFVKVKSHVRSTQCRFLRPDRVIDELFNSSVGESYHTKAKNVNQILRKHGKIHPISNSQIQSEMRWVEESSMLEKYVNSKGRPFSKAGLLVLKLVLNYPNIIAVTSNAYLCDEIAENDKVEQVLNWQSD